MSGMLLHANKCFFFLSLFKSVCLPEFIVLFCILGYVHSKWLTEFTTCSFPLDKVSEFSVHFSPQLASQCDEIMPVSSISKNTHSCSPLLILEIFC